MKNKGFTLIEIIVVIGILGVISFIITISLTGTLNSTKKDECDNFVKEIEEAACAYASLNSKKIICDNNKCEDIPLSLLVEEGLIISETDKCTQKNLDLEATVSVEWNSKGDKICTYNGDKDYER